MVSKVLLVDFLERDKKEMLKITTNHIMACEKMLPRTDACCELCCSRLKVAKGIKDNSLMMPNELSATHEKLV